MKTLWKFHLPCLLILACGTLATAQNSNLAGHWAGTVTKGGRSRAVALDLTGSDGKIGGTLSDPSGQVTKVENFKLDRNQFTFDTWAKEHDQPRQVHMVGEVEQDEIKLHRERARKSGPTIVLHRQRQ